MSVCDAYILARSIDVRTPYFSSDVLSAKPIIIGIANARIP